MWKGHDLKGKMIIRKVLCLWIAFIFPNFIPSPSHAAESRVFINFWPIFQYTSDPIEGTQELAGLGPFFLWKKDPHQTQWGVRPFISWTENEKDSFRRLEFPYPIGKYLVRQGEKKGYLSPLSLYREEESDGKRRWDFQLFPFFMGQTVQEEGYAGIFPFLGRLLDRYGKEEIRFYFWPLYSESVEEGTRTTNLIWPFFSLTEGGRKKGFRFWPFYGQREEVGVSQMEFFVWPIFIKQRRAMDTEDPVDERIFFPLYVSKDSKRFEQRTYLWPFFSLTKDRLTDFEQLDLPWPIFQLLKGEDLHGIKFFPLFGDKIKTGEMRRTFFLYPLYQLEEDRMGEVQEKTLRILLLSRIRIEKNLQGEGKGESIRLWPFFDYEKEESGETSFSLFYLFPFKDEGFERNLFPLFRLFRWEKDSRGNCSTHLLWGLYKGIKKEGLDSWEIAHLLGGKRENGWTRLFFLKGLFSLSFPLRRPSPARGDLKSINKESVNGRKEDWNNRDRLICSRENSLQY
jgi:hypothetical protein